MSSSDEKRPLGKILLQRKLVSQQELDAALRAQKKNPTPAPLASQLVDDGTVKEVDALRALSEQSGVPGIDLTQIVILLEHLDTVPRQLAETHRVLPVLVRSDRIFLATEDPHEKHVVDELEFVTGKKVYSYIAVHSTLVRAIAAAYDARARGDTYYLGPQVPEEKLRQLGLQSPAVIIEEAVETASRDSEVSSVTTLPDELRIRASEATAAMTGGTGKLILVVDDEEDIRKLLNRLLTQKGYRVIEADRGLLALRLVKDHVPDLIILDAMLPELHGFDIARRIKGSAKYGRIPIIMVSAVYRGWRIAADLKQNYGVEEYVEKPFRIGALLEVVTRLLPPGDTGPTSQTRDPEFLSSEAESALREGIAAYKGGLIEEAIEHLKRGVGIDPLSYRLHFHLALLFGKKGQIYEGIQELEKAIDLHPQHFSALKNLAVLYEKAGFKNRAVEMWERCAVLAPDEPTRESVKQHLRRLI